MVLNSPFTKTLYINLPPLPLWSSLSELSEMLPPRLKSSFCLSLQGFLTHDLTQTALITNDPSKRHSPSTSKAWRTEKGVLYYNAICTEVCDHVLSSRKNKIVHSKMLHSWHKSNSMDTCTHWG